MQKAIRKIAATSALMMSAAFFAAPASAASSPDSGIYGLPHSPEQAKVVLLPVPFEATRRSMLLTFAAVEAIQQGRGIDVEA